MASRKKLPAQKLPAKKAAAKKAAARKAPAKKAPAKKAPAKRSPAKGSASRLRGAELNAHAALVLDRLLARYPDAHCALDFRDAFELLCPACCPASSECARRAGRSCSRRTVSR